MKKLTLFITFFLICAPAFAAQFNIDHFNGVKWGTKLPAKGFKLELDSKDGWKFYKRNADHSSIEGIKVDELLYKSTNGRFDAAQFTFSGAANHQKVRALMLKMFIKSNGTIAGREFFRRESGSKFISGMLQYSNGSGLANFYGGQKQ